LHAEFDVTATPPDNAAMQFDKIPGTKIIGIKILGTAALLPGILFAPPAAAQTRPLGPNPSECEIQAALLGAAGPGCPPIVMKRPPPQPAEAPIQAPAPTSTQAPAAVAVPTPPGPVALPEVGLRAAFRINFDFNSARIRPESRATLDRVGTVMKAPETGNTRFRIVGHTDAVGSDTVNLALSRRRAMAVVEYLVTQHHIPRDRLDAQGMGAREPVLPDDPKAAENRRVEIVNLGE